MTEMCEDGPVGLERQINIFQLKPSEKKYFTNNVCRFTFIPRETSSPSRLVLCRLAIAIFEKRTINVINDHALSQCYNR